jgi:thioesterase domain-containing protein
MHALDLPPPPSSSLISIQGFGTRPPIFAVSGIGGNVVGLSELARALGGGQPLFGLQSKALDGDELPLDTIEAIAETYIEECAEIQHGPYVLLGICFGANVAIEMAHHLNDRNRAPALVIVLDPSFEEDGDSTTMATSKIPTKLGFVIERLRGLSDAYRAQSGVERRAWLREKRATLIRKIRHRNLLHGNRLEFKQFRVRAANLAAAERYRPRPYEGPMHAILTRDRPVDSRVEPRMKWIELVQRKITPVRVPGYDTGDVLSNHAHALASQIKQQIDAILEESSDPG